MKNHENKEVSGDAFEDGLRHILTHEQVGAGGVPPGAGADQAGAAAPGRTPPQAQGRYLEAVERLEKERKALFWFKLLRLFSPVALLALLALFAIRFTTFGS